LKKQSSAHGGARKGAGRPKGSRNTGFPTKEAGREALSQLVLAEFGPLVQAQIAVAKGIHHLVVRNKKTGKFERVTNPDQMVAVLNNEAESEVWELWERDPSTQAFTDLINRTLGKPAESMTVDHSGDVTIRWLRKNEKS
jgi:hypothetical protein